MKPFISFADIALTHDYTPAFITSTVAGAIEKYDLSDLMAALCPRKVLIINPLGSNGLPAGADKKSCNLSYPKIVYTQKNMENNFNYLIVKEDHLAIDQIIEWLK